MRLKAIISILTLSIFLFNASFVFAEEQDEYKIKKFLEEEASIIEPGVLPNSFWYWADIFAEEIKFIFTVGKEKKADYLIQIAEERLAEIKALSEAGITKYTEELITKHEESIKNAEKFYQELKEKAPEKARELQLETEREILRKEALMKKELQQTPEKYKEKRDNVITQIGKWFKKIVEHLTWKKRKIEEQRSEMYE